MCPVIEPKRELADLHAHLTSSISPAVYWHLAHSGGHKLPKSDYHDFADYITLTDSHKLTLKEYLDQIYHPILNKLSSGSIAVEKAIYESLTGAYRTNNITLLELRTNPMKHNHDGMVDLDHIILSMLRGMEQALLEYPTLWAGIIFCLDRQYSIKTNEIIIEKAIKYHRRGIIGIDFANYDTGNFHFKDYIELIAQARSAGLKVTAHSGETDNTNDLWDCLSYATPDRIGHGIKAAYDPKLMQELVKQRVVLEICPLSNIMTKAVKDWSEIKHILQTLWENGVKFCINTDWPEIIKDAHLAKQIDFIAKNNILTQPQLDQTIKWGFEASFVNQHKKSNLYL